MFYSVFDWAFFPKIHAKGLRTGKSVFLGGVSGAAVQLRFKFLSSHAPQPGTLPPRAEVRERSERSQVTNCSLTRIRILHGSPLSEVLFAFAEAGHRGIHWRKCSQAGPEDGQEQD